MNLAEQENHNQQHLLLSSSTTNDDSTVKTRRSSSVLTAIEPVVLLTEEVDDGESIATSKPFALSGILYSLLGCFLFCTATFTIKELQIDLLDALVIRFIIQIFLFGIFVVSHHYPIWIGSSKEKWLQLVLCILNGFVFLGYFIGFRYLPLPDLTTLNFTRLLWTVVFGILIYKEKPSLIIFLAVFLTLIGVVFVAQPTFIFKQKKIAAEIPLNMTPIIALNGTDIVDTFLFSSRMIGISLSLGTGLFSAFNLLIFKQLITLKLKTSVLILQHSFVFLLCLIFNQFYKYFLLNDLTFFTLTIFQWKYWLATLISLLQTLGVICGNRAVKRERPSIVTIVSASEIIYAILLQNIFTKDKSNLWVLLGSTLVISSVFLIGVHKFVQERKTKKKKIDDRNNVNK
ncbi:unnamed protein product [Adineta steineri]|uniref:EamA domain-containing protein n=1 Tax=Adineta steineri TaxID=433720 RepID=A0A813Q3K5_9BILA|nr:unnamed protein product [Adineta steineri]CAF0796985.1 unnamed protein product [Adineta steineri]